MIAAMTATIRCRRCGESLPRCEFRVLRKQYTGVCRACEYRGHNDLERHEREIRNRARRRGRALAEEAARRQGMLRVVRS